MFLAVFLFSAVSPVATSFDSRWTVYTIVNLWNRGTTNLDADASALRANDYYGVECVQPAGTLRSGSTVDCQGHWYSRFPVAVAVVAAPFVLAEMGAIHIAQPLLRRLHVSNPFIDGFLHGDYDAGHALLEMEAASALLAMTAVFVYLIARRDLSPRRAALLALSFGTATSAYSVAGRALWSHTPSMLLLVIAIYLMTEAKRRPTMAALAGLPVALSYTVRPTNSLAVIIFTAYVACNHRAQLPRYLAAAAPVAAAFFTYNFSIYHTAFSPYYQPELNGFRPDHWGPMAIALAGNLVSPSRGLLIYTPVFVFAIWNMLRRNWKSPLAPWLAALVVAHWIVVSAYTDQWWAGHSYGPRFFTDLTPVFALFLIPVLLRWDHAALSRRAAVITLALAGFAIHLRGGWSEAVYEWNTRPTNVDQHPERNWDWYDPPFLRSPLIRAGNQAKSVLWGGVSAPRAGLLPGTARGESASLKRSSPALAGQALAGSSTRKL